MRALALGLFVSLTCSSAAFAQGCENDSQCKGDRICESGKCVGPSSVQSTTPSVGQSSSDAWWVKEHLTWCAGNWGVNEGAQEAARYINAAVSAGYPNQVSAVVGFVNELPGIMPNLLKRPPVIDAARQLVQVSPDLAADLAMTCQNHNGGAKSLLQANRGLVIAWLKGQL